MKEIKIAITITDDNIVLYGENTQDLTEDDIIDIHKILGGLATTSSILQEDTQQMEMRKFVTDIHPDGTLMCCEYEDPKESIRAAIDRAWLAGYRQALKHCDEQVNMLKGFKGTCQSSDLLYQGAESVRYVVSLAYCKYLNIEK